MRSPERLLAVLVFCLLATTAPALAGGASEASRELESVRQLIADKKYNEALDLAIRVRGQYPDLRDDVDGLIDQINKVKNAFNKKYGELLKVLQEGKDIEKAATLAEELRQLDPNPDPLIQKQLTQASRAMRYQEDYREFSSVMDRAAALLAEGKPGMALKAYLTAFDLGKAEFDAQHYPLANNALSAVGELRSQAVAAANADASLAAGRETLDRLLAAPLDEATRLGFEASTLALVRSLAAGSDAAARAIAKLEQASASIASSRSDGQEDVWLRFITLMARGREGKTEGLLYAARIQWPSTAIALAEKSSAGATSSFEAAVRSFESGAGAAALEPVFSSARQKDLLAISSASALAATLPLVASGSEEAKRFARALAVVPLHQEHADEGPAFVQLALMRERLAALPSAENASREVAVDGRARAGRDRETATSLSADWSTKAASWRARASEGPAFGQQAESADRMAGRFADLAALMLERDTAYAVRVAALETAPFQPAFDNALALRDQGGRIVEETKQPAAGLKQYAEAERALDELAGSLKSYRARWNAEASNVTASRGLSDLLAAVSALEGRIAGFRGELAALESAVKASIEQAASLRGQGDKSYDKAVSDKAAADKLADAHKPGVTGGSYDAIVTLLDGALKLYNQSLALEDDARTRARVAGIDGIKSDAGTRGYDLRVQQVDDQVDQARVLYEKEDYTKAREVLDQAQSAWTLLGEKDPHPRLEYYLSLVNTSLGLRQQTVERADPLYSTINSLMFRANEAFAEAKKLTDTGTSAKAQPVIALLDSAQDSINAVKNFLPRYLNAELTVLSIRELREGKSAFSVSINADVAKYQQDLKTGDAATKQAAYDKLSAIYARLPKTYASLKTVLENYKKSLLAPLATIDKVKVTQAKDKVTDANRVYRTDDEGTWDQALYLLNQAQALDPTNPDAVALARKIRLQRGMAGDLLVNTDKSRRLELYNRALTAATSRDYKTASLYLDQLFSENPGFNNRKVNDLSRMVKANLGAS